MRLWVGHSQLSGDLVRYARRLNMVEVPTGAGRTPKVARLKDWRSRAPDGFVFSVVLPPEVADLSVGESDPELARSLAAAERLDAGWLVLRTPASVRPTERVRQGLRRLVAALPRERRVAWEPAGLWEEEESWAFAQELGVSLVHDIARVDAPPGDVVYSRLRTLGHGGRLAATAADTVLDQIEDREEVFLVVDGAGAPALVRQLTELLGLDPKPEAAEG